MPYPTRPGRSHWLLLLLWLALPVAAATAQIVREKPGRIKADNRKARREVRHTDTPYKDSHLAVGKERLKRGSSQAAPETREKQDSYKTGLAPNVKGPGLFGLRNKKKGGKKAAKEEPKK